MGSPIDGKAIPEEPNHQKFLLEMPDDTTAACLHVQELVRDRLIKDDFIYAEMVAAIKEALHLPMNNYDIGATIVITNAIREAIEQFGFANPVIIFENLSIRIRNLKATSKEE